MTSDATMLAEGVAVLYCRLALARHDDPLPLDLIAEVTAMEAPPGLPVERVAAIAERMARIKIGSKPSWWDVVACPDQWVQLPNQGINGSWYGRMRRDGVPHVTLSGVTRWRRPEMEAWIAANRGDEP